MVQHVAFCCFQRLSCLTLLCVRSCPSYAFLCFIILFLMLSYAFIFVLSCPIFVTSPCLEARHPSRWTQRESAAAAPKPRLWAWKNEMENNEKYIYIYIPRSFHIPSTFWKTCLNSRCLTQTNQTNGRSLPPKCFLCANATGALLAVMAWAFFLGPHVGLANAHPTSHTPTSYTPMISRPPSNLRNSHAESVKVKVL